jgi:glycosyltransferase involved in cell wall biosynthesis
VRVSGFTFCRNAVKYDYPLAEAIRSILPRVDEFVVNVGDCDDGTVEEVERLGDPKVRILRSVWDERLCRDGHIYAEQTNLALAACTGDWAFYVQADEVLHEADLPAIWAAMERSLAEPEVLGLMFRFLHFEGDYWSVNPWRYKREIRIVRGGGRVRSHGDAVGFQSVGDGLDLKGGPEGRWRWSGGRIFHYGWVKAPAVMTQKKREQIGHYHAPGVVPEAEASFWEREAYDYPLYEALKEFRGSHPAVMAERVGRSRRLRPRRNRWLQWRFYREVFTHGFKG